MLARTPILRPSFQYGLARSRGESMYPEMWNGLVGIWVPAIGHQGITTLRDWSPFKNNGTLTGGMDNSDWVIGRNGYALDFDGTNDYIDIGTPAVLNLLTALSVLAWVRVPTVGVDRNVASKGYNGTSTQWFMKTTTAGGKITVGTFTSPTTFGAESVKTLTSDTWTHLAGTYDGTTWRIYWDGVLDNSNAVQGPTETTEKVVIGAVTNVGTAIQFWTGQIDDVRIYNRALTFVEVMQTYLGASPLQLKESALGRAPVAVAETVLSSPIWYGA